MREELLQTFREAAREVRELQPEDQDALVRIGICLEEAQQSIGEEMPGLKGLLGSCLEALQSVYRGVSRDPSFLLDAVSSALAGAERYLLASDEDEGERIIRESIKGICKAIDGAAAEDGGIAGAGDSMPQEATELTLDDVAAMLVQTEPLDLDGLARIRDALTAIAERESTPPEARPLLNRASLAVGDLVKGDAAHPDEALTEAARMLEEGARAMAGSGDGENLASTDDTPEQGNADCFLPQEADPDLLGEFLTECSEYIQDAEAALLSLEMDPEKMEAVNEVFRIFHTIKGTSALLGLNVISELAHKAESLLSRMRDGEISCTGGYADLALCSVDMLKELLQLVQDAMGGDDVEKPQGLDELMAALDGPEEGIVANETDVQCAQAPRLGDILVAEGKASREDIEVAMLDKGDQPLGIAVLRSGSASLPDVARALRTQRRLKKAEPSVDSSVRVRTDRLDKLIDMVGELVIAHSMVSQDEDIVSGINHQLMKKVCHTGKIVRELQDLSMSMRMVPLRATFQKMARLVRDLANKSGKVVNFQTEGGETEIDRNMVDILSDPLVHMLRNAVDHGIETPQIRQGNGKPPAGKIKLSAYHSGGSVVVEIMDDGKGLDRAKLIKNALSRGLLEPDRNVTDSEAFNLIFIPGFSSSDNVSEISGRGVGMDVVKKGVDALGGSIQIASEKGKGCTFTIRLPLTLAITDGMLVRIGGQRFILPTASIDTTFRPDRSAIHTVGGRGEMVMFRGIPMPLFRLSRLLGIQSSVEDPCEGLLVVVGNAERRCALLVDELLGQQQVVAKPLGKGIGKIKGVSGGAILGDGRVGLILDSREVVALAGETGGMGHEYGAVTVMGGGV